jgi:hypothetical protein
MEGTMKTLLLSLAAALTLVAGCSPMTVNANVSPTANLSKYKTFSWLTSPYQQGQPQSLGEQQVHAALVRDLAQKGMVEAPAGTPPDFLIAIHKVKEQKLDVSTVGYGYWGWGGFPDVTTYTQGTLIVDFVDPQTNKVFWRGTASAVLDHPENPNVKMLDKAVSKLVNQYPGMVAATSRPAM